MKSRSGFTLIEILVVITIVAILAVLAVSSYSVARRQAKLSIVTDTVMTVLRQQQSLAKSGRSGNTMDKGVPTCYGMIFTKTAPPYIQTVQAPYISVDASVDLNKSDFCDLRDGFYETTAFSEFENFIIPEISVFGTEKESYALMFRPPEARVSGGESLNSIEKFGTTGDPRLMIKMSSANGTDSAAFTFDVTTGIAEKLAASTQQTL